MMRRRRAAGVILPVVLPLVAVLALLVVFVQHRMEIMLTDAHARADRIETERALADAEAVLVYLLATQVLGPRNVEVVDRDGAAPPPHTQRDERLPANARSLALDGRPYRLDDVIVEVQDTRGLVNLRTATAPQLEDLLRRLGVPKTQRDKLVRAFQDHRDGPDDAAAPTSAFALPRTRPVSQAVPGSRRLSAPWDVRHIAGWSAAFPSDDGWSAWADVTAATDLAGLNVNTARAAALASLPGMTEEAVAAIVAARRDRDIHDAAELAAVTGVAFDADDPAFAFFPGSRLRVRLTGKRGPPMREVLVVLTPQSPLAPWHVGYSLNLPVSGSTARTPAPLPTGDVPARGP